MRDPAGWRKGGCLFASFSLALGLALAAAAPARGAEPLPVRMTIQFGFHFAQGDLIQELKLMDKYSPVPVRARVIRVASPAVADDALLSKTAEFSVGGMPAAIIGIVRGAPFKILAAQGTIPYELLTWRKDVKSIADFKVTDKVGFGDLRATQYYAFAKAWLDLGRPLKDMPLIAASGPHPDLMALTLKKEIAAYFAPGEPYRSKLKEAGMHTVATMVDIFGAGVGVVWRVRNDFYEQHPRVVLAFLAALIEANNILAERPREAARVLAPSYKMSPEEALRRLAGSGISWSVSETLPSVRRLAETLGKMGVVPRVPTEEELFNPLARGMLDRPTGRR